MNRSEFLRSLKTQTSDAAVFGTLANLENPAGREPRPEDIRLAAWYSRLTDEDRAFLGDALREAAELAIFGLLCIVDGVASIEDGDQKGRIEIRHSRDGVAKRLSGPSSGLLHDQFNSLCRESLPVPPSHNPARRYEVGTVRELRQKQTAADGLDVHAVGQQTADSNDSAPAIALPRQEHRKL